MSHEVSNRTGYLQKTITSHLTQQNQDVFGSRWEVLKVPVVGDDEIYPYAQAFLATKPIEFKEGILIRGTLDLTITTDAVVDWNELGRILRFDQIPRILAIFSMSSYVIDEKYKPSDGEKRMNHGAFLFGRHRFLGNRDVESFPDPGEARKKLGWLYHSKMFQSTKWQQESEAFLSIIRQTENDIDYLHMAAQGISEQQQIEDESLVIDGEIVEDSYPFEIPFNQPQKKVFQLGWSGDPATFDDPDVIKLDALIARLQIGSGRYIYGFSPCEGPVETWPHIQVYLPDLDHHENSQIFQVPFYRMAEALNAYPDGLCCFTAEVKEVFRARMIDMITDKVRNLLTG